MCRAGWVRQACGGHKSGKGRPQVGWGRVRRRVGVGWGPVRGWVGLGAWAGARELGSTRAEPRGPGPCHAPTPLTPPCILPPVHYTLLATPTNTRDPDSRPAHRPLRSMPQGRGSGT